MFSLPRPPRWALLTLALLVVANVVLFSVMALRPAPRDPAAGRPSAVASVSSASATVPERAPTPAPSDEAEPPSTPVIAVYGDGYTSGSAMGGQGAAGWPALLAERLDAELQLEAVSRTGYEALGVTGRNFADLVSAAPAPDATVTVIFGSRNDLAQPVASVGEAATETYALAASNAPETQLVVVGPTWSDADVPAELSAQRDEIASAAEAAGAIFVDPIADGWFRQPAGMIADDGVSPTDAGHRFIATALIPVIEDALRRL